MPTYEHRCRTCDSRFEVRRPMAEAGDPAPCPAGHHDTVRLLSTFAAVGTDRSAPGPGPAPAPAAGGCCGGACGCG